MRNTLLACSLSAALFPALAAPVLADGPVKPTLLLKQEVGGMPMAAIQEIKVLSGILQPGEKSIRHTHAFPVTIYVAEGELTLEIEGQSNVRAKAGEVLVEPANVHTTAINSSSTAVSKSIMFYASASGTPFLVPVP